MVRTNEEDDRIEEGVRTVLAPDIHFKGKLKFKSSLMIKGRMTGEISADGTLIVGPNAVVKASVSVGKVINYGKITGNVTATVQIEMKAGAAQYGDISTPDLTVESGCIVEGRVNMVDSKTVMEPAVQTG